MTCKGGGMDLLFPRSKGGFGIVLYELMSLEIQVLQLVSHTYQLLTLLSVTIWFHPLESAGRALNT